MNSKKTTTNSPSTDNSQILRDDRPPASRLVLFLFLMIIGALADLVSKTMIFNQHFDLTLSENHQRQHVTWLIDGVLGIQTSTNPGALFGMGSGYSWLFAIFSVVALAGIVIWLFVFKAAVDRWLTFALGLVAGGIIGNCYDRLGFGAGLGYPEQIRDNVRDWIYFRLEGVPWFDPWPNFNIADSLLVVGAFMLFVHSFVLYKNEVKEERTVDVTPESSTQAP